MRWRFRTENGTIYEVDKQAMGWRRISSTPDSGFTRHDGGRLVQWPELEAGARAELFDDDILPGHIMHCVLTSKIVAIWECP
jgi:hypothetical protein